MENSILNISTCVKCSKEGKYYVSNSKQASYCKECFLEMVHHKFSYNLGKFRVFKEAVPQHALIVFTGNAASALLLSFICRGLSLTSSKKLRIKPSLLFLFTGNIVDEITIQLNRMREMMGQYKNQGWNLYFVHIAASLATNIDFSNEYVLGLEKRDDFSSLISLIKDQSLKQEVLQLLKKILIVRIARFLRIGRVVVPENAEYLANISLNAFCFGRGSSICELTSVVDNSIKDVHFIRPLRDILDKEIQIFHKLQQSSAEFIMNCEGICKKNMINSETESGGIQYQNATFICSLVNGGFPATVPTILSTASKVEQNPHRSRLTVNGEQTECLVESGNVTACEVCFSSNATILKKNIQNGNGLTRFRSSHDKQNICEPCATIFDEISSSDSSTGRDVYRNLIKIITNAY